MSSRRLVRALSRQKRPNAPATAAAATGLPVEWSPSRLAPVVTAGAGPVAPGPHVSMTNGHVSFTTASQTAGYYRIEASGPDDSQGWTTVDVGVNPDTLP
jgi:hypothetical protein